MATLPLTNNFNGGVSGATVSVANSGGASGDAFSAMTGSVMSFATAQSHQGGMAVSIVDAASTSAGRWTGLGNLTTSVYLRAYVYLSALPQAGSQANVLQFDDSGVARVAALVITSAGKIRTLNAAGSTVATGSVTVPTGQWIRIGVRCLPSTTVGEVEYRLYTDPDSSTIAETINSTGQVLGASIDGVRVGLTSTTPATPFTIYIDDAAASGTDWLGPIGQILAPVADVSAGTWTPSTGSTIYTMLDEAAFNDTDYALSSSSPLTADEMRIRMGTATDPAVGTGHTVSYRYLKDVSGGDLVDLTVTLYTANGATAIQSWTHTNIGTTAVTANQTLGTTDANAIPSADYATGLILGFSAIKE